MRYLAETIFEPKVFSLASFHSQPAESILSLIQKIESGNKSAAEVAEEFHLLIEKMLNRKTANVHVCTVA
jgi:hypothetical protein